MSTPDYSPNAAVATGLSYNWSSLVFTTYETTPRVVTFAQVTDVEIEESQDTKYFSANAAKGPTHKVNTNGMRKATVTVGDMVNALAVPRGVQGKLVGTINDIYNGALVGSETFTLANCSLDSRKEGGKHNEFAEMTLEFSAIWVDGVTDPLTWVQS